MNRTEITLYINERVEMFKSFDNWFTHEAEYNYEVINNLMVSHGMAKLREIFNELKEIEIRSGQVFA